MIRILVKAGCWRKFKYLTLNRVTKRVSFKAYSATISTYSDIERNGIQADVVSSRGNTRLEGTDCNHEKMRWYTLNFTQSSLRVGPTLSARVPVNNRISVQTIKLLWPEWSHSDFIGDCKHLTTPTVYYASNSLVLNWTVWCIGSASGFQPRSTQAKSCSDWRFSWFPSVSPGEGRDNSLQLATSMFHIFCHYHISV